MRKLLALARRPVVWLSVIAFAFWLVVLRAVVPPPPVHVIVTGETGYDHDTYGYVELNDVADDGSTVTYTVVRYPGKFPTPQDTHPHIRNTRDGEDVTPARWADINGESLPAWQLVWRSELWRHPEGRAFVYDEEAWAKLKARFSSVFAGDAGPIPFDERGFQFGPRGFQFSSDGRFIAFHSRDGEPDFRGNADGITVEETRTGRRVAFLRGETGRFHLAPGGQTAVTELEPKEKDGEHPRLAVWDLATSSVRVKLSFPAEHAFVTFTPDGRFVFAEYFSFTTGSAHGVRWWDTSTGQQIGQIDEASSPLLTANGRVLVTQKTSSRSRGCVLQFWDVESGESLGETHLGFQIGLWHSSYHPDCVRDRRMLFALYPKPSGCRDWLGDHAQEFHESITGKRQRWSDLTRVIVWDAVERREVLRVPGKRPALSANGRWLATLDEEGVIRVWDVNALAPWNHALGYAIAAGAMTVAGVVLGLRYVRWCRMDHRRWWWAIPPAIVLLVVVANALYVNWPDSP